MQGNLAFFHIELGTLGANKIGYVAIPYDMQLIGVSGIGSNAHNAVLDLGTVTDGDGIYDGVAAFGVSKAGIQLDTTDFNGALATAGQPYPLSAGDELEFTIDYDGASGTAIQLASLTLIFTQ